jgi:glucose-1-phosphate cytidylyltransferase
MKTVLFCGGLGTRIRDVSESIPKPMIPIGDKPILWHLMHYYSQFGHKDFVLCLGYKANVIKEYFLNYKPQTYADCVVTGFGNQVEILGDPQQDWRIAMIDTGIWRNIGERLRAVREHVAGEEMFLANYSDGLSNVNLPEMIKTFRASGKIACFTAVRPSFSWHLVDMRPSGKVQRIRASQDAVSGSTAASSSSARRYSTKQRAKVMNSSSAIPTLDRRPVGLRHEGFWRPDGHPEGQADPEDLVEKGTMPWLLNCDSRAAPVDAGRKIG